MLFFCFSSKDRQEIVESILYHVTNYRIPVWYDRHEILLGDDRDHKNFVEGVAPSKYGIIVLSPNSINSICANEEIELMHNKHVDGTMTIFPLFFNIEASDVPIKYEWMKTLVYKEVKTSVDVKSTCNHIVCKILLDELENCKINTFDELIVYSKAIEIDCFIHRIIESYLELDGSNFNARIALLYAACVYIEKSYNTNNLPIYYTAGLKRLFNETKLSLEVNLRELIIIERVFLLLVNSTVLGNIT